MIEGQHFQNAYVTRNLDRAVAMLEKHGDVRKILQFEVTTDVWTPAGMGSQTNKLAFVWVEDLQYELIQPLAGAVSLYSDALPAGDEIRFHHICMRVDNWDDFRQRVDQQSCPVVLEGGSDELKFIYLDARELVGHYLEYTWMTPERWQQVGGR